MYVLVFIIGVSLIFQSARSEHFITIYIGLLTGFFFSFIHHTCANSPCFLGIGSFTIVDGEKVTGEDVGNK